MPAPSTAISEATEADLAAIVALRTAVAEEATRRHGRGHWSSKASERGVARALAVSQTLVERDDAGTVVALLRLTTRKPWAIDAGLFTPVSRPLYLVDMIVRPDLQGRGRGRALLEAAKGAARERQAGAIRLDAYEGPVGAGEFYRRCGFREVGRAVYRSVPLVYFEWLPGQEAAR